MPPLAIAFKIYNEMFPTTGLAKIESFAALVYPNNPISKHDEQDVLLIVKTSPQLETFIIF